MHNSFAMRRKTLVNNLLKKCNISRLEIEKILEDFGLSVMIRPENITVEDFVKLSNKFEEKLKNN